jgi:hypothetical protein
MMSISPDTVFASAPSRPYAGPVGSFQVTSLLGSWVCGDHMSAEHNPTVVDTTGSKRLSPGSFAGVLT